MTTNKKRNWLTALTALSLAACTAEVMEPGTEVGQLDLPLLSSSADGTQFMLEATFDLTGPESMSVSVSPADPSWGDDTLMLNPRVGSYMLAISAWRLWQVQIDPATGTVVGSAPVMTATLLSNAVQGVTILNNQTSNVLYQFSVPGTGVINFARGTLSIDFTVLQGLPAGSACSSDTECQSHICAGGTCNMPSCSDGVQNGGETTPDCGGGCTCGPQVCAMCPAGTQCVTYADGTVQCAGGSPCGAAEAATCPDPAACVIDVTGMISCGNGGNGGTACSAVEAAVCPDPAGCFVLNGLINCGSGGTTACTAADAALCPDPAACFVVNGVINCGITTCDPTAPGACPVGQACTPDANGNTSCQTAVMGAAGSPCNPSDPMTCDPGLMCFTNANGSFSCG